MILRRVMEHVRAQNWAAIVIDFVIVVVGVFIGIQVSNWNDGRAARAMEIEFLRTVRDDIERDIVDTGGFVDMLADVTRFGTLTLESIERESDCARDCWLELLRFFQASQWIDVRTNRATFDEIKRTGLPRNPVLKAELTRYYGQSDQYTIIVSDLPKYRELIRSLIPASVQRYMWLECIDIDGRQQILSADCASPITDAEAGAIVELLRSNPQIKPSLNFWLSTVGVVSKTLRSQNDEGLKVIALLDTHLAGY